MQSQIIFLLSEENLHPFILMRHLTDQKWLQGTMYAVQASDAVGLELFGEMSSHLSQQSSSVLGITSTPNISRASLVLVISRKRQ